jgi:hypothetical protein
MSLPAAYLRQKLTQPLPTKDGTVLRTIGEAANYMLALSPESIQNDSDQTIGLAGPSVAG